MSGRRRSSSITAPAEVNSAPGPSLHALETTQKLWELACYEMVDQRSKQTPLHYSRNICFVKAILDRAHQLDHCSRNWILNPNNPATTGANNEHPGLCSSWLESLLKKPDGESGYTPLHRAVLRADLPTLLLLMRYATVLDHSARSKEFHPALSQRLQQRPLTMLQGGEISWSNAEVAAIFAAKDKEGMTAFNLLERLQVRELELCRKALRIVRSPGDSEEIITGERNSRHPSANGRPRQNSFGAISEGADQNELADLDQYLQEEQHDRIETEALRNRIRSADAIQSPQDQTTYGCEVLAFGRSNHLALGVFGGNACNSKSRGVSASPDSNSNTTTRPHRLERFSQDRVGREGSAIAVAAAAHHTLVATRDGHLFSFGVGTGGRLGTGDHQRHSPAPTRVLGSLSHRRVIAIAAAEKHSLCATSDGAVYAFGSNRFGQLGDTSNANEGSRCCLPRRVDDLWKKHVLCVTVAAGEKHSVALSQKGEVYVWGCNASGQLGIPRRSSSSNNSMVQRVQRVDALWNEDGNNQKRRICFKVAASSQATLVLARPCHGSAGTLPVNQVYAWGHGNHVPSRVQFGRSGDSEWTEPKRSSKDVFLASDPGRQSVIDPVAIACARYHNVAIASNGRVYTWGFHADSLGGSTPPSCAAKSTTSNKSATRPQLVTGMLPEEGGGFAVAVSASENHTAVVTDEGSLFTWGASHGKGVLGHEGVRWQPKPKRVSGVSRAIAVSAAKEHTVLLMGASFPGFQSQLNHRSVASLEQLAAEEIVKHVDIFNVIPVLMTAERTNCQCVVDYCHKFISLNMDGVLNVGQKSIMDLYLREEIAGGLLFVDEEARDCTEHPSILDFALVGKELKKGVFLSSDFQSDRFDWIKSCEKLYPRDWLNSRLNLARRQLATSSKIAQSHFRLTSVGLPELPKSKDGSFDADSPCVDKEEWTSSERCIMLTTNMDLSTRQLVQAKYDCLTREIRGLKKRLGQIAKLESMLSGEEDSQNSSCPLSPDQIEKIARRPMLESELCIFEPALERVKKRMLQFNLRLRRSESIGNEEESKATEEVQEDRKRLGDSDAKHDQPEPTPDSDEGPTGCLKCSICNITCPDSRSYELHINGRKHRNRVSQEAEEEQARAAALMMEERQRQQMEKMSQTRSPSDSQQRPTSAWVKCKVEPQSHALPKFKLPPPSNLMEASTPKAPLRPKSLHEIIAEEEKTKGVDGLDKATFSKSSRRLKTPPISPFSAKALASPAKSPNNPMRAPVWGSQSGTKKTSFQAKLRSPNDSQQPSIGDFLCKPGNKSPSITKQKSPTMAPWSASAAPKHVPGSALLRPKREEPSSLSFHDIQKQEEDFRNNREDHSLRDSSWFLGRRERAGSLAAIQEAEARKKEEEQLIEEQKWIEKQIQRELEQEKLKGNNKKDRNSKKKGKQNKNSENNRGKGKPSPSKKKQGTGNFSTKTETNPQIRSRRKNGKGRSEKTKGQNQGQ